MKKAIFYFLLLLTPIFILNSCKTAETLYSKAKQKDEAKVADMARKDWPCIVTASDTTYRIDTLVDIVEVLCPDPAVRVDSFETSVPVYVKVPVKKAVKTTTVNNNIKDSADIFLLLKSFDIERRSFDIERSILEDSVSIKNAAISKLEDKVDKKNKWLKIFGISSLLLAVILGLLIYLNIRK
jgi:hypothetical protein